MRSCVVEKDIGQIQKKIMSVDTSSFISTMRTGAPANYPSAQWGRCKWYDANKKYGFLVPLDSTNDVFVHENDLRAQTPNKEPPFLVTGEYVQYVLVEGDGDKQRDRAINVSGLAGGPLLCENGTFTFTSYQKTFDE